MTANVPPRRVVEDHVSYEVVSMDDSSVRFRVVAESDTGAKIEALHKIGFAIVAEGTKFVLADSDEPSLIEMTLTSSTLDAAYDEAIRYSRFIIREPNQMIGGSLGDGFGEVDDE